MFTRREDGHRELLQGSAAGLPTARSSSGRQGSSDAGSLRTLIRSFTRSQANQRQRTHCGLCALAVGSSAPATCSCLALCYAVGEGGAVWPHGGLRTKGCGVTGRSQAAQEEGSNVHF